MILWKSFGASVVGPGHIAAGKSNQDAWASCHSIRGDYIAVSDGLGSKPFSNLGSKVACFAVERAFHASCEQPDLSAIHLSKLIKTHWLSSITPLEPRDCAATCLFAMRLARGVVQVGMLGDGLTAVLKVDGTVILLCEDKTEGFSNVTSALTEKTSPEDWRLLSLQEEECEAVLLCSDGISDDLENIEPFVKAFIESHRDLSTASANRQSRKMLDNWPTPKHSDDKTIACLCREEVADE